jgi:hypothetical protein
MDVAGGQNAVRPGRDRDGVLPCGVHVNAGHAGGFGIRFEHAADIDAYARQIGLEGISE